MRSLDRMLDGGAKDLPAPLQREPALDHRPDTTPAAGARHLAPGLHMQRHHRQQPLILIDAKAVIDEPPNLDIGDQPLPAMQRKYPTIG